MVGDQGPMASIVAVGDVVVGGLEVGDDDEVPVGVVDPKVSAEAISRISGISSGIVCKRATIESTSSAAVSAFQRNITT